MIPSILASHLRQGVEEFLRTTFPFATPHFHGLLDRLFEEDGTLFKGPYLSVKLPFKRGVGEHDFFPDLPLPYSPYLHQEQAFQRLGGAAPDSTLIATGTGSGKAESFLWPILNHCYHQRGQRGIKALLIYPMNALATDQARRIAEAIWTNPNLKGNVTAGLFIGDQDAHTYRDMGEEHIVTDKNWMRKQPPDILLTNYKMLDYLLVRPRDRGLWSQNDPETLRFLAVDELHSFDGAQGGDLACLIRRLKARLKTPARFLCCIGTSATLGGEAGNVDLRHFAAEVFGEPFDAQSIISESRQHTGEFLAGSLISASRVPGVVDYKALLPESYGTFEEFFERQVDLWFPAGRDDVSGGSDAEVSRYAQDDLSACIELGHALKQHTFFRNLLTVLDGETLGYDEVLHELRQATPKLREAAPAYAEAILNSLIALISRARKEEDGALRPFLDVRLQLWLRELRRMVCRVGVRPELAFADDLASDAAKHENQKHLPLVHCRDCGSTGWAGLKQETDAWINPNLKQFYVGFFDNAPGVTFAFPDHEMEQRAATGGMLLKLCGQCLHLSEVHKSACNACGSSELVRVFVPDNKRTVRNRGANATRSTNDCPYCGSHEGLTILGSRAASMTSVFIAQLFSSRYNADKKLIAFSDSVQDASHRAGFFTARTYRFNFRTALQQSVQESEAYPALAELPAHFATYWSERMKPEEYVATFLAPNMAWFEDYEYLKQQGRLPEDSRLVQDVNRRIAWEIFSEYGFQARIGRTLEKTGSSIAMVDPVLLKEVQDRLTDILQNEVGGLRGLNPAAMGRFLAGMLSHLRTQGGLFHGDVEAYVGDMGNAFLLTRKQHLPNFGSRTRAPAFLTTRSGTRFDTLLSKGASARTWNEAWAIKTLLNPTSASEEILPDVFDYWINVGAGTASDKEFVRALGVEQEA